MDQQAGTTSDNRRTLHVGIAEHQALKAMRTVFPHGHVVADSWEAWGEKAAEPIPGPGGDEGDPWHLRVTLRAGATPMHHLRRLAEAGIDLVPARDGVAALVTDGDEIEGTVHAQWTGQQIQDQLAIADFNTTIACH